MPIRLSAGLRDAMVGEFGLERMMRRGHIQIYTGPQPLEANLPPTGTLIARVTENGSTPVAGQAIGGLLMQAGTAGGSLTMANNWVMRGTASGAAGWWRFVWNEPDIGDTSLTLPRIDGSVGESLLLDDTMITPSTNIPINEFFLVLPYQ